MILLLAHIKQLKLYLHTEISFICITLGAKKNAFIYMERILFLGQLQKLRHKA